MGFFTDDELGALAIMKMDFQVVGDEDFAARPRMPDVEHAKFFLARILDVDVAPVFKFTDGSSTKAMLEAIASRSRQFSTGAVDLAQEFHRFHRGGQTGRGALFTFELSGGDRSTKLYAMLKYDYGEVLRPSKVTDGGKSTKRLRRILDAFVQDKRALQKSALFRVVDGEAEALVAAKDRAAKSPNITDFFAKFLDAKREREDDELNKAVSDAIFDIIKHVAPEVWPQGQSAARATVMEILRSSVIINDETVVNAVYVAAGKPDDEEQQEELKDATMAALRRRKVAGLEFPPDASVLKFAAKKKIKTKEKISIEYPESLQDVRVITKRNPDGSATITITTEEITFEDVVPESIGTIRRSIDD